MKGVGSVPAPWAVNDDTPRMGEFPTEDESMIRLAGMRGTGQVCRDALMLKRIRELENRCTCKSEGQRA